MTDHDGVEQVITMAWRAHIERGAFMTFVAADGSGYIRVTIPNAKKAAAFLGGTEAEFDYVEHLLIGLRSVTYYGRTR